MRGAVSGAAGERRRFGDEGLIFVAPVDNDFVLAHPQAYTQDGRLTRRFALLEPPAKGLLRFTGSAAREQARETDVFIQIRPVDSFTTGDKTPVGPLGWRSVRQSREPRERHRDRAAIRKFRYQGIVA